MDSAGLSKLATKVKRTARAPDVLALVDAVEEYLGTPPECQECRRRREATAARVKKHRKNKAKGAA
jgi:hypothetical protein